MRTQHGFALLMELMAVMTIMAILALGAMPSYMHHNNLTALRKAAAGAQWSLLSTNPVLHQPDPTVWVPELNATTGTMDYVHTTHLTRPLGLLVVQYHVSQGTWSCSFTDPTYVLGGC